MSTTRIFDPARNAWIAVSSNEADNISVNTPSLLPEGQPSTDAESVLANHEARLKLAEGNIAWLALHGGGGTDGGNTPVAAVIVVNGKENGATIEFDETDGLRISVQAASPTITFSITAASGTGATIATATNAVSLHITKAMLTAAHISKTFNLSVNAYDPDTETFVFWNGTILISNIELTGIDAQYTYHSDGQYSESVIFNYETDSTGAYSFYINDIFVEEFSGTYTTIKGSIVVPLSRIIELLPPPLGGGSVVGASLSPGLNIIRGSLRNANNEDIRGEFALKLTLLTESPIITCHTLSTDPTAPTSLGLFGTSIAIQTPFSVWFSGTSFQYKIAYAAVPDASTSDPNGVQTPSPDTSLVPWSSAYISYNQEQSNASILIDEAVIGESFVIRIMIRDSTSQLTYYQDFFITLAQPASSLITTQLRPLFDFCSYSATISNNQAASNGYKLNICNANYRSQSIQSTTKSLRLQNASYATIDAAAAKAALTVGNQLEFSINLQFRCDYHPDDARTILQWGTLNSAGTTSTGLMVRAHDVYLGNARLCPLEDSELIDITVTYKSNGTDAGLAIVYIDGCLETSESYDPNILIDQILQGGSVPPVILAASSSLATLQGSPSLPSTLSSFNYTDCDIYRVALYDKCLSPYEVMLEHLNNDARAHLTSDGLPDTDYITEGLRRNMVVSDADSTDPDHDIRIGGKRLDSQFYKQVSASFDNNSQNLLADFNLTAIVGEVAGTLQLNATLKNFYVPIPIMFIDMSRDGWTYTDFVRPGAANLSATEAVFHYYDQNGSNKSFITQRIQVSPQGTSTLADYLKNLEIEFPDDVIFSPRAGWFPERVYTIKADIVDSSHSLNPSIGRFVNEEFGYNTRTATSKWYPLSDTVVQSFNAERSNPSSAISTYFPEATIKHGVEGFPVLVIVAFTPEGDEPAVIRSLGFYQFILGRKSPRNLGYEIITDVRNVRSVSYPLHATNASLTTKSVNGYWMEFTENDSFGNAEDFQSLADKDSAAWRAFSFTGAFWQGAADYFNTNMEVKYSNLPAPVNNVYDFQPFVDFAESIQHCPVMIRHRTAGKNKLDVDATSNSYKQMSYDWVVTDGNGRYEWRDTGDYVSINTSDALMSLIYSSSDKSGILHVECISKAFVIFMTFGLLDNFQKNLPFKFFQRPDGSWEPAIIGIYDTDSGIGQDNQSDQNVDESLWLSGLTNAGLGFLESHTGNNRQVVANNNKMWFIDTPDFIYAYLQRMGYSAADRTGSIFATAWNDMKRTLISNGSIRNIDELADYFYDKYFLPQTEGCGELLFALTYIAKYITKYATDSGSTNQIDKLHGRRRYQVKHWLRNRIKFLDSMFNAMGLLSYDTPVNTPTEVTVRSATGPACLVTMNTPVITKYTNQGNTTGWMFCDRNVPTELYFGAPALTSDYSKIHTIQHPNSIIELGGGEHPLYNIGFAAISTGALPFLTVYDVSAPSRNAANMNGLASMNDSYMSDHFRGDNGAGVSELRTIDFRNTYPNGTNTYNMNLRRGFDKLQNLYINNSCINAITFPEGVPLRDFNVAGSKLNTLTVENQGFISELDITDCDELTALTVNNCDSIRNVNIGATNVRLNTVSISSNNLETITVNNNSVKRISLVSTGLKSVVVHSTSLETIELGSISALTSIDLSACTKLHTISFSFSSDGGDQSLSSSVLTSLNLYDTSVSKTVISGQIYDYLNLSPFTALTDINLGANEAVEYIQFANIKSAPVPITHAFTGCTNLKRVYGHIAIKCSSVFQNCAKFSIHGSDLSSMQWHGRSVLAVDGHRVLMPYEALGISCGSFSSSMLWQDGDGVTNFTFAVTSAANDFYGTAYTIFDVYYVLSNLGSVTSLSYTFRAGVNTEWGRFNWTEDYDNSPHRNMFYWASRVTTMASMFYGCGSGSTIRLFSPSRDGSEYINDGLYSVPDDSHGLASCTSIRLMWGSYTYIIDRHLFRLNGTAAKPLTDLGYFYPKLVVDDVNTLTAPPSLSITSLLTPAPVPDASTSGSNGVPTPSPLSYGNLSGFFTNLGSLTDIHAFMDGTLFIDYDVLTASNFKFPSGVKTLKAVLRSQYAVGEIRPQDYFRTPSNVVNIYHSFRVTNALPSALATLQGAPASFHITSGMLDAFTNIESIGYLASGDNSGAADTASFGGAGLTKVIDGEFPYTIFSRCSKLKQCVGFFMGASLTSTSVPDTSTSGSISLPGVMFQNTRLLEAIDYLFYNVQFDYTLSDNQPFSRCSKLHTARYAFAQPAVNADKPRLTGSIPVRFFYTGSTEVSVTLRGNNVESFGTKYEYDQFGSVTSFEVVANPVYDDNGNVIDGDPMPILSVTHSYTKTNASITDLSYCFQHCGCDEYINPEPTIEGNVDYSPFRNTYSESEGWSVNPRQNTHSHTYMWEFDGVNHPQSISTIESIGSIPTSCDNLDECSVSSLIPALTTPVATMAGTANYCCPPDLLRYCAPNCNITGLFAYSGTTGWSSQYNNGLSLFEYGLTGRIPPHLLRPVPNTTSIAYLFRYCRRLSSYTDYESNVSYLVPHTFFQYATAITSMQYAFAGMVFPSTISLNVFSAISRSIDVTGIFYQCYYNGTSSNKARVVGVFQGNNITACSYAFALSTSQGGQEAIARTQHVSFSNVFKGYTSDAYRTNVSFAYVFNGYAKSTVVHESTKTLCNNTTTLNYAYSSVSDGIA